MKRNLILIVSLALNVFLLANLAYRQAVVSKVKAVRMNTVVNTAPPKLERPAPALLVTNVVATNRFDWRAVESADYRQYISNLRAIGCPEDTIRDIIAADVNKLFESRRKAIWAPGTNRFEYWKSASFFGGFMDEGKISKSQDLAKEQRELLKQLLGTDVPAKLEQTFAGVNPLEHLMDFLSSDKQTQLMELEQKFAARLMKSAQDAAKGNFAEMRKVQSEKDAEMLKMLTPEEKFEYDLRLSQSAMVMRVSLGDFEPSEQEFRDLFKLRKRFDDEFGLQGMAANTPEERERRAAAQKELTAQIKTALGDERYRDYQYEQDWTRSSLKTVAQQHNIPKETAFKVFDVRDVAQEQASKVRQDAALTPAQRQAALDGIRAETEKAIGDLMGQKAMEDYVKQGSWIKNLNRAARPNPGTD